MPASFFSQTYNFQQMLLADDFKEQIYMEKHKANHLRDSSSRTYCVAWINQITNNGLPPQLTRTAHDRHQMVLLFLLHVETITKKIQKILCAVCFLECYNKASDATRQMRECL
jgi:hypothetical protein